jgi:hypothetical protein
MNGEAAGLNIILRDGTVAGSSSVNMDAEDTWGEHIMVLEVVHYAQNITYTTRSLS